VRIVCAVWPPHGQSRLVRFSDSSRDAFAEERQRFLPEGRYLSFKPRRGVLLFQPVLGVEARKRDTLTAVHPSPRVLRRGRRTSMLWCSARRRALPSAHSPGRACRLPAVPGDAYRHPLSPASSSAVTPCRSRALGSNARSARIDMPIDVGSRVLWQRRQPRPSRSRPSARHQGHARRHCYHLRAQRSHASAQSTSPTAELTREVGAAFRSL
jgi:hypothetical protein